MINPTDFELKIIRQHWIKDDGQDDKLDLCSHGEVLIKIGDEQLSNKESGSWNLSTAGLYLLRSLNQDCELEQFLNQLVPCCGHFMIPDENGKNYVVIMGCPNGIDWAIKHTDNVVAFESPKGAKGKLPFEDYKQMVIDFTNEIEEFYGNPKDKILPDEEFYREGFNQFWSEWFELKNKWKNNNSI